MFLGLSKDLQKKIKNQLSKETSDELEVELKEITKVKESSISNRKLMIFFTGGLIIVILLPVLVYFFGHHIFEVESFGDTTKRGSFGDFFNGITTPIISFCTLVAAIWAYLFQQKQFNIQKEQTDKQRIENQFFQLINLHNEIVNSMHYDQEGGNLKGRAYFREIYQKFIDYYNEDDSLDRNKYYLIMRRIDNEEYDQLYHYFRNMYQLFRCVYKNQNKLSNEEQGDYIEIINAQLTYYEKHLLFFNTKFYGSDGFFDILEHYKFFKEYSNENSSIISRFESDAKMKKQLSRDDKCKVETEQDKQNTSITKMEPKPNTLY
ncbi:putative phage abortive infection protein [Priestia megaterium]|uniref:putative phage abortive infection protein n=1 Tax=Priestia megaterium TaxID=1404 RepID=UPI003F7D5E14